MRPAVVSLAVVSLASAWGAGAIAGCRGEPTRASGTGAQASASAAAPPPAPSPAPLGPDAARPSAALPLPCRAIALEGHAKVEPTAGGAEVAPAALAVQADVPQGWLVLAEGSRLVVKDPRTARETTFHGPARVRACVGGSEEVWLAQGAFESTAGAGEAPGSEEWVVTPHAVLRYAAAKLRVDVLPASTTAAIGAGVAFVWPPRKGPLVEGWQRLDGGDPTRVGETAPAGGPGGPLERCTSLAQRSKELAAGLLSAVTGGSDAGVVAEQVTTRRLARAACAIARVRLGERGGADAGGARAAAGATWEAKLAEAEATWRALPLAPVSQ